MSRTPSRRLRALPALTAPLLATALLAGCSSNATADDGNEPQTITVSVPVANTTENAYQDLADEYMKAHKGVTVKVTTIDLSSFGTTLTTQLQAGNAPDIFYVNPGSGQAGSVDQLTKAQQLLELTDPEAKAAIPDDVTNLFSRNGKTYALPVDLTSGGIIYNDEAARSMGIVLDGSSSFSDLLAQCAVARTKGKALLGLAGSAAPNTAYFAMELAGSTVYGPTPDWNKQRAAGKTTFAETEGWHQALQGIQAMDKAGCFQDGVAGAGFDALTNGMSGGQIFGFFAPGGGASDIMKASGGAVKLVVIPLPSPSGKTYLTAGTTDALAGNAKTDSPKLVRDFLTWFVQRQQAKTFADTKGDIPVGKVQAADLLPQYAPVADAIVDQDYAQLGYLGWANGQVYDALGSGITGLLTGQKSVDDVLQAMDQAWS